jgi:uncharacterized delta-60 repeat protein
MQSVHCLLPALRYGPGTSAKEFFVTNNVKRQLQWQLNPAVYRIESLEPRRLFAAGSLDPTFGGIHSPITATNGISLYNTNFSGMKLKDAVVQTDGKIVVLFNDSESGTALARFNADGSLDTGFGGGLISGSALGEFTSFATIAIQSNGKIIAAGGLGALGVTRFLSNGNVDSTFGSGGSATIFSSTDSYFASDIVIRPDDRIVIGGSVQLQSKQDRDFAIFALSANGQTDNAFAGGAQVLPTDLLGGDDDIAAIKLLGDGRIVATGSAADSLGNPQLAIALYSASGQLDQTFDADGLLTTPALGAAAGAHLAVQGSTNILLLDPTGPSIAVARFTPEGILDNTFGIGGVVSSVNDPKKGAASGGDLAVEPSGNIIVGFGTGQSGTQTDHLVRLFPAGSTDTSFKDTGTLVSTGFQNTGIALIGPGNTVYIATATTGNDAVIARFDALHAPTPAATSSLLGDVSSNTLSLQVTYTGEAAIDPATIAPVNVRLAGPQGYSQEASSVANIDANGNTLAATYFFPPPGGTVDPGDTGTYTISVGSTPAKDVDGNEPALASFASLNLAVGVALPDIAFSDTSFAAGTYFTGDSIAASLIPTVVGSSVGIFGLDVVLSADNIAGNADDIPLFTTRAATSGTKITSLGPIPDNAPTGNYYLIATLDSPGAVGESSESNNLFVTPTASTTIGTPPPPAPSQSIGGLDPTFGFNGLVRPTLGFTSTVGTIQQPDGKLLLGGFNDSGSFGLARLTSSGTGRDTSFGDSGGVTFLNLRGTNDRAVEFQLLPDGRILEAGTSTETDGSNTVGSDFFVARFNSDGSLDTTFGDGGRTIIDFAANANLAPSTDVARDMLVTIDGKIVLAGKTDAGGTQDIALVRLNADGTLDPTFGTLGKAVTDFAGGNDGAQAIVQAASGAIVAAGFVTQGGAKKIAVAQYLSSGVLDSKFGVGGIATITAGGTDEQANALALGTKGEIVVAGYSATGSIAGGTYASAFAVARFTSRGKADSKFGQGGIATKSLSAPANATSVLLLDDGRVFASGVLSSNIAEGAASHRDLAIVRFTNRGLLDTSFGENGVTVFHTDTGAVSSLALKLFPQDEAADDALDDFQNSAEGKLTGQQGGGALLAGSNDAQSVVASVVTGGVELSGTVTTAPPATVIGGAKGSISVAVANLGDVLASGAIDVTFYTSADQTLGSGDRAFATLPGKAVKLKPLTLGGKAKTLKAKFVYPSDILDGTYYLLADVNSARTLTELNPNNNTAFTNSAVQINAPFVDLTGQALPGGLTFPAGKATTMPVTIANNGNIALKATVGLQIFLSSDTTLDVNDVALGTALPAKLSLKAQSSKATKVKLTPPAGTEGNFFLFIVIDPTNQVPERNESNNLLESTLASQFTTP